jgi:DNA-binding transcriptional LysR family regulator
MVQGVPDSGSKIGFQDLESLVVLIEELHFGRAAERLGTTQSSLARSIRRLEGELDVPLVTRRSVTITPTEAGLRFAEHARPLLGALQLATAEARRAAGGFSPLRVGCVPDLRLQQLQTFLGAWYMRHATIDVDLAYLPTAEQLRRLRNGELDLGLVRLAREEEGIDFAPLYRGEPLVAYMPMSHRLAARETISPGELADGVLAVSDRDGEPVLHDRLMALLTDAGHRFAGVREIRGHDARSLLFAVADHHCVAVAPGSVLDTVGDIASLVTARPLAPEIRAADAVLAWRASPPGELDGIVALAREAASSVRSDQGDEGG